MFKEDMNITDIERIVWGGLVGVTVVVVGQLLSKFVVEPLYELRKEVGNVRFSLALHSQTINTPMSREPVKSDAAADALRISSANLFAKLHAVPGYSFVRHIGRLPNRGDVERAAVQIRGLSTYVHEGPKEAAGNACEVRGRISTIERLLRLKPST